MFVSSQLLHPSVEFGEGEILVEVLELPLGSSMTFAKLFDPLVQAPYVEIGIMILPIL